MSVWSRWGARAGQAATRWGARAGQEAHFLPRSGGLRPGPRATLGIREPPSHCALQSLFSVFCVNWRQVLLGASDCCVWAGGVGWGWKEALRDGETLQATFPKYYSQKHFALNTDLNPLEAKVLSGSCLLAVLGQLAGLVQAAWPAAGKLRLFPIPHLAKRKGRGWGLLGVGETRRSSFMAPSANQATKAFPSPASPTEARPTTTTSRTTAARTRGETESRYGQQLCPPPFLDCQEKLAPGGVNGREEKSSAREEGGG